MRILLTGFEPFLGHALNPTERIVTELGGKNINDVEIIGEVLPVAFSTSASRLIELYEKHQPDAVIMLGLAAGRNRITPERVAINCNDGEVDNEGQQQQDAPIKAEGPTAYFSTLPIRKMVTALTEANIPATISNTAGTYLCNNIMYQMLDYLNERNLNCPAGFVHIPASHELALTNSQLPSMSHEELVRAVEVVVTTIGQNINK
ncbi:pyroglutamyl-peptidase I [Halalkalibacter akibai]|uniref:Pyrrolidone-carboxylate peptidase n=1 Tax=Halalkalibacter akibai (strain ATCC 43226 / DSM 21942 / CIP 109018 / JCM 9157 / 1139) TaxID=1236973 RepID=W4QWX7_HALA3|nr:pyroglutamyl-peptidase I [Halalkalibacter akibai]GAE35824.1 pyrrolidone-carboxylate peptidase [Halalkalibacter akibai JCM 9157]